jgi:hypothetical protein
VFFSEQTEFSQEKHVLHSPASNNEGFPWETHVFHHLTWIGVFEAQGAFLPLEHFGLQELFLSKHNTSLTGKTVLHAPASNTGAFLLRDTRVPSI